MNNALCRMTGAEFPLFAFSHCRDVVAAVSRAGGFDSLHAKSGMGSAGLSRRAAEAGSARARQLATYESGQGVGMIEAERSASAVVLEFKQDFAAAFEQVSQAVMAD